MKTSDKRAATIRKEIEKSTPPQPYRVLLPLTNLTEARVMFPLAQYLAQEKLGRLVILHVVTVPDGHALSEATADASRSRQAINQFLSENGYADVPVKTVVRVAREVWEGIWETVEQERIDLLTFAWQSPALEETAVGSEVDPRLGEPPCAVVTVRAADKLTGLQDWQSLGRILLSTSKGTARGLALRVAQTLAEVADAQITLFHVTGETAGKADSPWLPDLTQAVHGLDKVTRLVTAKGDIAEAILEESQLHDLVLMGAPTREVAPDGWRGPIYDTVSGSVETTLIVVKDPTRTTQAQSRTDLRKDIYRERTVAVVVDKWFAENTFKSREFADMEQLMNLKETRELTISLGLPALNEEETVGNVIQTVKTALMDEVPLLDEMVLIDSGSVDYTREIAADLGIPVYIHQDILPRYGSYIGKGEALWKSLYVLKGDIIAWIDTDIKNIHPRFVYGVLGPLLRESRIHFVKGYYRRPLLRGDRLVAGGGGRVTELTVRPFFNLFFPELSGLIQPLSGEYAGRRQTLEQLPFFSGYGVETGLLIDVLNKFGLQAIAQVDLLERIHRNQKLHSLSKMSFAIMQVVMNRLEQRHNVELLDYANLTMNLVRSATNRLFIEPLEIQERERPAMDTLPEYRELHGLPPLQMEIEESVRTSVALEEGRPS